MNSDFLVPIRRRLQTNGKIYIRRNTRFETSKYIKTKTIIPLGSSRYALQIKDAFSPSNNTLNLINWRLL